MDHEKVIDKVQKLLRLSQSTNANEASLAAQMAQELIEKYKLESFQLNDEEDSKEAIEDSAATRDWLDERASPWRKNLAAALASSNQCVVYSFSSYDGHKISLVGRRSDAQIVRYMYAYLVREIRRLSRIYGDCMSSSYRSAFKKGAVVTISQRLQEARKKVADEMRPTHSTALVVIDKHDANVKLWVEDHLNLRSSRQRRTRVNSDGYADGKEAGHIVNLGSNPALGSGSRRLRG